MSDNNTNIPNEDELWDLLSEPVSAAPAPKAAKSEPVSAPAPAAEPAAEAEPEAPKAEAPASEEAKAKPGRKIDSFFIACMAGVAAVSVAVTLLATSLIGGGSAANIDKSAGASANNGGIVAEGPAATDLERENAELRAQLDLQKEQIKDLQNDLMTLMGSEEYLASASTDPSGSNEVLDAQLAALDTLAQIQEAYADFDRERLEELIPEMDAQLSYLTPEALNNYYLILEYVEQPSNG